MEKRFLVLDSLLSEWHRFIRLAISMRAALAAGTAEVGPFSSRSLAFTRQSLPPLLLRLQTPLFRGDGCQYNTVGLWGGGGVRVGVGAASFQ